ncbi:hypothetical protein BMS3Abin05_00418 [bacterium BMS3Abin05]|nr:hypothetical protein BMS3Abin05_00418 [bacterium BMS3Abin05]GBE26945.1 hypothetical protein BMS3Bbin03_00865 [bacterium BMS3Bbin03]
MNRKLYIYAGLLLAIAVFGGIIQITRQNLDVYRTPEKALQDLIYLPDGHVLRWASLGYTSLMADYLWIKSVLYYGRHTVDEDNPFYKIIKKKFNLSGDNGYLPESDSGRTAQASSKKDFDLSRDRRLRAIFFNFRSRGMAPFIYPLLERVVILDPHFIEPYIFGGLYVMMDTGRLKEALHLLRLGYKENPNRWELPYYLAFLNLFYLGDSEAALAYLKKAVLQPGAPPFVENLSVVLSRRLNKTQIVIDYLMGIYNSTTDPNVRDKILKVLHELAKR